MLLGMHVKNLALIDETEVEFQEGLNILTGETGAGKSIIIGSMNLALGEKVPKELLKEQKDAYVELVFSIDHPDTRAILQENEIDFEEDVLILSRKISNGRSVGKINGVSAPATLIRQLAGTCIHLYGQQEHATLLHKANHLDILDSYGGDHLLVLKKQVASCFDQYQVAHKKFLEANLNEDQRAKELELLQFEINELEQTNLTLNEDEQLEVEFQRLQAGHKILNNLGVVYELTSQSDYNISDLMNRAMKELQLVSGYDPKVNGFYQTLQSIEESLNDMNLDIQKYLMDADFSDERYQEVEQRLNLLNHLKDKYRCSLKDLLELLNQKIKRSQELENYEMFIQTCRNELDDATKKIEDACVNLSELRRTQAQQFVDEIKKEMSELNFLDVKIHMEFAVAKDYTREGNDIVEFYISLNPGEKEKPLAQVASGGELSRIMLAIKSVLAEKEEIPTIIFDEIDAGISGRTAQMVSEKLHRIGKRSQVICITHLPQIAAMADAHYQIEKSVEDESTVSRISALNEDGILDELARMLGGAQITETVYASAREMKALAMQTKNKI